MPLPLDPRRASLTSTGGESATRLPCRLGERLWTLGHHHYNLYLVRGERRSALVEVGVSATVGTVVEQLEGLDTRPDYLVVTHPHADHLTGLQGLRDAFPGAKVLAAPGAREFAEHPRAAENLVIEDRHIHRIPGLSPVSPRIGPVSGPPSLADWRTVGEGDGLDLGGVSLDFMELRGHSPGHLGVHVPEEGALLVSDALGFWFPDRAFLPMFFTGYADYVGTLARLKAVGAQALGLGHQGFFAGEEVAEALAEARGAAVHLLGTVRDSNSNSSQDDGLADRLFEHWYRDELRINSEGNIRNCIQLLIKRCRQALSEGFAGAPEPRWGIEAG